MIKPQERRHGDDFYQGVNTECVIHVQSPETGHCFTLDTELSNVCDFSNSEHMTGDDTTNDCEKDKSALSNVSFQLDSYQENQNGILNNGVNENDSQEVKTPI